jgi:signal transduction histidine kinase/ActR/RegA family two-component response regulator
VETRGELSPGRDFSIALAITLLAGVAIFSAPGPTFPTLHTILNTGIAIVTAVVSLLFWDVGVRSGSILVRYMAIIFAVVGVLEVMHVIAALEPSSGSQWLNTIHQRLRSGTWAPPAYLLPLGVGFILWTAPGRFISRPMFAICTIAVATGLFVFFQWLPRYAPIGFLGILRPSLLLVPLLWIPIGLFFWRRRKGHRISHALAFYAFGTAASHAFMLWSGEATSKFAMTAHFGVFAFGLRMLLSLMQMGTMDMERRRRVERELTSNKEALETRVAARTAELETLNTDLRREIGVRHKAEVRTLMQLERLELLSRITRGIAERHDLASIFQLVVRSIEEHLPVDFAALCNYQRDASSGGPALVVSRVGARSEQLALELAMTEEARIEIDHNGLSRCVTGQLVYEPDVTAVKYPFPQRLARAGMRSMVIVPLRVDPGGVFAVLVVARRGAEAFSSGECEFLRQLCDHVALAANQAQLHASLQKAYEDQQRTQAAVLEHERLRALGQMASGIAHDINNAISPASVYVDSILEYETGFSERTRKQLEIVRRAVDDVARTVARMGEFYRKKPEQLELAPVAVERILREVLELTRARWSNMAQQRGAFIDTRVESTAGNPMVMAIESELREALINLVLNAIDAMPEGGKLVLRTGLTEGGATPGRVYIEVTDSGLGMDENTRRRCLEPFFTTKGERGSGLGLAMVYGIAQRHEIQIDIVSAPGAGTTFRLTFPKRTPGRAMAPAADPKRPPPTRILLVDDDPLLLASLSDVLGNEGHEVHTAAGGQEGIDAFLAAQNSGQPFPIVLTDLGMPHVDGRAVAAAIAQLSPTTPVIMLTGWGQRLVASGDIPPHVVAVLSKPPNLAELRQKLSECLGQLTERRSS